MEKATKHHLKKVKELLRDKNARDENGIFIAEGNRIIIDLINKKHPVDSVIFTDEYLNKNISDGMIEMLDRFNVERYTVSQSDYRKVSSLRKPEGILAVVRKREGNFDIDKNSMFCVLCDGIKDPGNLGTIIRAAVAFDADLIAFIGESVDIYNPKVVRASSGMIMDIDTMETSIKELKRLKEKGFQFIAGFPQKESDVLIHDINEIAQRVFLVLGSEGRGISEDISDLADIKFNIPVSDKVESLNVAGAASIALYHLRRKKNG